MDISKALGVAKGLKNHFRAFEFLDEFVNEASALHNLLQEIESRKAALQKEIVALTEERDGISEDVATFKQQKAKQLEEMEKTLSERSAQHSAKIKEEIEALHVRRREAEAKMGEGEARMEEMEKLHAETRQRMEQEIASLVASRNAVEKGLRNLKAKLE